MAYRQPAPYQSFLEYNKPSPNANTIWSAVPETFAKWPRHGELANMGNFKGDDSFKVSVFNLTSSDIEFNITFEGKYADDKAAAVINAGPGPPVGGTKGTYNQAGQLTDSMVIGDPFKRITWRAKALLQDAPTVVHICSVSSDPDVSNYSFRWRNVGEFFWTKKVSFPIPDSASEEGGGKGKNRVQVVTVSKGASSPIVKASYQDLDHDCKFGCDNRCMNENLVLPTGYFNEINKD